MSKRFNVELLLENIVGIVSAGLVLLGMVASAFWVLNNPKEVEKKPVIEQPKKVQTVKAESISADTVEKLYQKKRDEIAAKKAADLAEKKRLQAEKERVEKEKQRLVKEEKQKKIKALAEKKKLEEEKKRLTKEKKRLAEKERKTKEAKEKAKAEAEKKHKAEEDRKKAKAEAEKKRKAEEDRKKVKAEAEKKRKAEEERSRIAKELADDIASREAEEARIAEENAKKKAIAKFGAAITDKVKGRWVIPAKLPQKLSATLQIKTELNGRIKSVKIIRSSGNIAFDNSAVQAVKQSSPLPMPKKADWAKEFNKINMKFP